MENSRKLLSLSKDLIQFYIFLKPMFLTVRVECKTEYMP